MTSLRSTGGGLGHGHFLLCTVMRNGGGDLGSAASGMVETKASTPLEPNYSSCNMGTYLCDCPMG